MFFFQSNGFVHENKGEQKVGILYDCVSPEISLLRPSLGTMFLGKKNTREKIMCEVMAESVEKISIKCKSMVEHGNIYSYIQTSCLFYRHNEVFAPTVLYSSCGWALTLAYYSPDQTPYTFEKLTGKKKSKKKKTPAIRLVRNAEVTVRQCPVRNCNCRVRMILTQINTDIHTTWYW